MRDALVRDRCLFETATGQAGYFTAVQARACDYSWALLSHHAARGRFVRVRRGLYRLRDYPSSPREEVMAAWLAAGPGAVVSHESALDLLGLTDVIPDRINLTVARSTRGRRPPRALAIHTAEQSRHPRRHARNGSSQNDRRHGANWPASRPTLNRHPSSDCSRPHNARSTSLCRP